MNTWKKKMHRNGIFLIMLLAFTLLFAIGCESDDDGDDGVGPTPTPAYVRAAHLAEVNSAVNVDVVVNGQVIISDLAYQDASGYAEVEPGTQDVEVREAGTGTLLVSGTVTLSENGEYTFALFDDGNPDQDDVMMEVVEDEGTGSSTQGTLRIIHATESAGAFDFETNSGISLETSLGFGNSSGYVNMDVGAYTIQVRGSGDDALVMSFGPVDISAGEAKTIWLTSEPGSGNYQAAVTIDAEVLASGPSTVVNLFGNASAMVRGANFIVDNLAMTVEIGTYSITGIAQFGVTNYQAIDPGTYQVVLRDASNTALASAGNITFTGNEYYTALGGDFYTADQNDNHPQLRILEDGTTMSDGMAALRFAHEAPETSALKVVDANTDETLVVGTSYQLQSVYVELESGVYDLELQINATDEVIASMSDVSLASNNSYTLFARGLSGAVQGQIVEDAE